MSNDFKKSKKAVLQRNCEHAFINRLNNCLCFFSVSMAEKTKTEEHWNKNQLDWIFNKISAEFREKKFKKKHIHDIGDSLDEFGQFKEPFSWKSAKEENHNSTGLFQIVLIFVKRTFKSRDIFLDWFNEWDEKSRFAFYNCES